jgi:hypothetical protein|tara:strand:+ start:143 stop:535 length:393 start_codon:yes stop_codon:yes gene_type:complete
MYKLILIFLIFSACSPTKRLNNLLSKNKDLIESFDTTVHFETKSIDTSFVFSSTNTRDTFFINNTKTRIFRYHDTLTIEQDAIKDSATIKTHNIKKVTIKKKDKGIFRKILILLALITVIFVAYTFRNAI